MVTLEKWFESMDYEEGLTLLRIHSKNRTILQNLTRKRNADKLEYELRKIALAQSPKSILQPIVSAPLIADQEEQSLMGRIITGCMRFWHSIESFIKLKL